MKKIIFPALLGLVLVFGAVHSDSVPNVLFTLGVYGLLVFFVFTVLRPWWRARKDLNENRPSYRFYGFVSLIWFVWLIAASALFIILSNKSALPAPLQGHANEVQAAALNPASNRLASAGLDRTIRVWNVPEHKLERELPYTGDQVYASYFESFTSVALSPDNSLLAIGSTDKTIRIWSTLKNTLVQQLVGHAEAVTALAFSPDGTLLASASADKTVRLWRVVDWTSLKPLQDHTDQVTCIAFSVDGKYLASGSADRSVRVYQVSDWSLVRTLIGLTDPISAVAFSSDDTWVLAVSKTHVFGRWLLTSKDKEAKPVETHRDEAPAIVSAAFSNDGKFVATGDDDNKIRIWDTVLNQKKLEIAGHSDKITSLDFAAKGDTLVSGSKDKTIRIWNATNGANIKTQNAGSEVVSAVFNSDASGVTFTAADRFVRTFKVKDENSTNVPLGTADQIVQLAFSGDGKTLVSASRNGYIQNWKMDDGGALLRDLVWQAGVVTSLAVNPTDANNVAIGNQNGIVRLLSSPSDSKDLNGFAGTQVSSLAFNAKGDVLAGGGIDQPIRLWKADGSPLPPLPSQGGKITSLVFSPDGKILASASLNHTVVLRTFSNMSAVTVTGSITLPLQAYPVTALKFSDDSQTLFTGRLDGNVSVWNVADGARIDVLNSNAQSIKSLGTSNDGTLFAAGLVGTAIQISPVAKLSDLQNRSLYSFRQFLLAGDLAPIFWAMFLGLVIAAGIVLAPIYGYSGIAARVLDQYPGYDPRLAHQAVFSIQLGINKIQQLVLNGEIKPQRPAAGRLAMFGGPGVLIVEDGHAVVLMASGRITRVVGNGITWLKPFERAQMVVWLPVRVEKVVVPDVLTFDKMVLNSFELLVFHRADRGDESGRSGQYTFDQKVILEKVWSPKGTDWPSVVHSMSETTIRDVVAQFKFEDIVSIAGASRRDLIRELTSKINQQTQRLLGVEVIGCNIGAIAISERTEEALRDKGLAEVIRQTRVITAEGEKESMARKGEGQALALRHLETEKAAIRRELLQQLMEPLLTTGKKPLKDPQIAQRYIEAVQRLIERLEATMVRDDLDAIRYVDALEKIAAAEGDKTFIIGDTKGFTGPADSGTGAPS